MIDTKAKQGYGCSTIRDKSGAPPWGVDWRCKLCSFKESQHTRRSYRHCLFSRRRWKTPPGAFLTSNIWRKKLSAWWLDLLMTRWLCRGCFVKVLQVDVIHISHYLYHNLRLTVCLKAQGLFLLTLFIMVWVKANLRRINVSLHAVICRNDSVLLLHMHMTTEEISLHCSHLYNITTFFAALMNHPEHSELWGWFSLPFRIGWWHQSSAISWPASAVGVAPCGNRSSSSSSKRRGAGGCTPSRVEEIRFWRRTRTARPPHRLVSLSALQQCAETGQTGSGCR